MKLNIKNNKGKYILILVLGIVFYIILAGKQWVSIEDDSIFYMNPTENEGVMPGYPFFLAIHKWVFGAQYLNIAVVTQGILALICTLLFVLYLERRFCFRNWETVVCYLFCMLPYAIYLPESNITHQIMTEGVAYSLVYLYFFIIMNYVQNMKLSWAILIFIMNLLLMLLRSQLIVLFVISILILMYVQIKKSRGKGIIKIGLMFILGVCCSVVLVFGAYRVRGFYMEKQDVVWGIEKNVAEEVSQKNMGSEEHNTEQEVMKKEESMSQFLSLMMIRGFLEMDDEDVDLFETEEKKELFRRLYSDLDEKEYRYAYATRQDLYMWRDLFCGEIGSVAKPIIVEFINENPQSNLTLSGVVFEFSLKIIVEHMGRFIYHTWRMMIPGFISSIFFQIEKIYLLCHFITLFLYLFSVVGCIICFRTKRNKEAVEFMGITLLFLITLVIVTNIIFIGLQRYMVYAMGLFYCAIYVIVKELFLMISESNSDVKWIAYTKRVLYGE